MPRAPQNHPPHRPATANTETSTKKSECCEKMQKRRKRERNGRKMTENDRKWNCKMGERRQKTKNCNNKQSWSVSYLINLATETGKRHASRSDSSSRNAKTFTCCALHICIFLRSFRLSSLLFFFLDGSASTCNLHWLRGRSSSPLGMVAARSTLERAAPTYNPAEDGIVRHEV